MAKAKTLSFGDSFDIYDVGSINLQSKNVHIIFQIPENTAKSKQANLRWGQKWKFKKRDNLASQTKKSITKLCLRIVKRIVFFFYFFIEFE